MFFLLGYDAVESFVIGVVVVLVIDWFYPVRKPASWVIRQKYVQAIGEMRDVFSAFHQGMNHNIVLSHLEKVAVLLKKIKPLLPAAQQEPNLWKSPWRADVADDLFVAIGRMRVSMGVIVHISKNLPISQNEHAIAIREQGKTNTQSN